MVGAWYGCFVLANQEIRAAKVAGDWYEGLHQGNAVDTGLRTDPPRFPWIWLAPAVIIFQSLYGRRPAGHKDGGAGPVVDYTATRHVHHGADTSHGGVPLVGRTNICQARRDHARRALCLRQGLGRVLGGLLRRQLLGNLLGLQGLIRDIGRRSTSVRCLSRASRRQVGTLCGRRRRGRTDEELSGRCHRLDGRGRRHLTGSCGQCYQGSDCTACCSQCKDGEDYSYPSRRSLATS